MTMEKAVGTASNDAFIAGLEAESFDGLGGRDTVSYANSTSAVKVDLATGKGSGGFAAGDLFAGIEAIAGSKGNDTLLGAAFAETLSGGAGNDLLYGSLGADSLDGGAGIDKVTYSGSTAAVRVDLATGRGSGGFAAGDTLAGIEQLNGSAYNDTLLGGTGAETLAGLDGNDLLYGSLGADKLDGGAGIDKATYSGSTTAVKVDLSTGRGSGGFAVGDVLTGIEQVNGSQYGDTLLGGTGAETLAGLDGNDLLYGSLGADSLDGGVGTDKVTYSGSTAAVKVDLATGKGSGGYAAGDTLAGIEQVNGSKFKDTLIGDDGNNYLAGLDGDDSLAGGAGNDMLDGGAGADILDGGGGFDFISYAGSTAGVTANLGAGAGLGGHARGDVLRDIEGVIGSRFNDSLTGGTGNDTLDGGAGADTLDGGAGRDMADYSRSSSRVRVDLGAGTGLDGDAQDDVLLHIEQVSGSGFGDSLTGGADAESLHGGAGDDTLEGGAGADYLHGGDGFDIASYASSTAGVFVGSDSTMMLHGHAQGDTLISIEGLIGSIYADTLLGDMRDNLIIGGAGADYLDGAGGVNTVDYSGSNAAVTVYLTTGRGHGGHAQGDTLSGFDVVIGSAHNDRLTAGSGNHTLLGGGGGDLLEGGAGADYLDGGTGYDTVSYAESDEGVAVNLTLGQGRSGHAQGDVLVSIEALWGSQYADIMSGGAGAEIFYGRDGNDVLTGQGGSDTLNGENGNDLLSGRDGNDVLRGGEGNDTLFGGTGDDILYDGGGNDSLTGEEGADTFEFLCEGSGGSVDRITDFSKTDGEIIILRSSRDMRIGFAQSASLGDSVSGVFGTNDALVLNSGQNSYVYVDVNQDRNYVKSEDHLILVQNTGNLTGGDVVRALLPT